MPISLDRPRSFANKFLTLVVPRPDTQPRYMLRRGPRLLLAPGGLQRTLPLRLSAAALTGAAATREAIHQCWRAQSDDPSTFEAHRLPKLRKLMDDAQLSPAVARDDDISAALGESMDRLLLLLVPLDPETTPYFKRLLELRGRNGLELPIRTIQHLFARVPSYGDAMALFHLMRTCNVNMNMHSYLSMVYCLQRLEEEGVAKKLARGGGGGDFSSSSVVTPESMHFIVNGCDNQLVPEKKPWIGRVMFADADEADTGAASRRDPNDDYDALGIAFAERFRNAAAGFRRPSGGTAPSTAPDGETGVSRAASKRNRRR